MWQHRWRSNDRHQRMAAASNKSQQASESGVKRIGGMAKSISNNLMCMAYHRNDIISNIVYVSSRSVIAWQWHQ